jgi:hypothetical protein
VTVVPVKHRGMKLYGRMVVECQTFYTSVLDGGEYLATLPLGTVLLMSTGWKAGWAPEMFMMWWQIEKSLFLPGIEYQSSNLRPLTLLPTISCLYIYTRYFQMT